MAEAADRSRARAKPAGGATLDQLSSTFAEIASGADQSGVRVYNERLLLSLVRRFGPLSKIEVARLTGLSVQSTSAIMNRLQADGLLKREAPLRGRVGQPTVPMSLDPDGAFSLGLKIGRRSCDLVLVDFRGAVRQRAHLTFAFPTPALVLDFVREHQPELVDSLSEAQRRRIAGLGVAAPFQLWSWEAEIGAPAGAMDGWREFDAAGEVAKLCAYPVTLCNDATSACAAEFFFGGGWRERDFLYFFLGAFLGGGLVLDGALCIGRTGNAGAVGSMPVRPAGRAARAAAHRLRLDLSARSAGSPSAGADPSSIWPTPAAWADFGAPLDAWIDEAAEALAYASVAAISVIDFAAIVIDGAMPASVRDALPRARPQVLEKLDRRGFRDVAFAPARSAPTRARSAARRCR